MEDHCSAPVEGEGAQIDEEQLRRECDELAQRLSQDPLTFENKALEVQLEQMKLDYKSLQDDFQSMGDYFSQRISEMTAQLEDQRRAASQHQGHADCLSDLFHFHEDQGRLAGSYWRAQCEKRDDSIKFLSLKLQEYTVPSAEYQSRRQAAAAGVAATAAPVIATATPLPEIPGSAALGVLPGGSAGAPAAGIFMGAATAGQSVGQAYQLLLQQHAVLCQEAREQEEVNMALERELEESELFCASLRSSRDQWAATNDRDIPEQGPLAPAQTEEEDGSADPFGTPATSWASEGGEHDRLQVEERELQEECDRLETEVKAAEVALHSGTDMSGGLPAWANRCVLRDELDVRAGQLERISLQFDATKRLLDAANEELQWQAMSAEALRMRLSDVQRAADGEEAKAEDLRADHRRGVAAVGELLVRFENDPAPGGVGTPAPHVCHRAQELLESIRRSDPTLPLSLIHI